VAAPVSEGRAVEGRLLKEMGASRLSIKALASFIRETMGLLAVQVRTWMCKYHIVSIPKYGRKAMYNQYKKCKRHILKQLYSYKGVEIIEGHLMINCIHMLVSVCIKNQKPRVY
jgi:hypothetical protein